MPVDPRDVLIEKLRMLAESAIDVLPEIRGNEDALVDDDGVDLVARSVSEFHYTAEEVEAFDYLVHLLARSVFGVDGEGWSPIQIILVDKKRQEQLHVLPVQKSRMDDDPSSYVAGLEPAISNVKSVIDSLELRIRMLCSRQRTQDKITAIRVKAKGCGVCKGRGYIRVPDRDLPTQIDHDLVGYMPFGSKLCDCQRGDEPKNA